MRAFARCVSRPNPRFQVLRRIHESAVYRGDEDASVFPDSLQKTLEAHRASNRASLVRMVPSGSHGKSPSKTQSKDDGDSDDKDTKTVAQSSSTSSRVFESRKLDYSQRWGRGVGSAQRQSPWLSHYPVHARQSDAMAHLHAEIHALDDYLTPTWYEKDQINQLTASISDALAAIAQPPQLIGSWRTGLAICYSGLDFVLPVQDTERSKETGDLFRKPSANRPKVLEMRQRVLQDVGHILEQTNLFKGVHLPTTQSPVLTVNHIPTSLEVRFVCGEGPPPLTEYVEDYLAEYPSIRPLYRTIRLLLDSHGLFSPQCSSLTPTALLMLLVALSKMNHGRFQRPDSLGEELLAFLDTYGSAVDLITTGVAVSPPGWFNHETLQKQLDELHGETLELPAHLRGQRALINLKRNAAHRSNIPIAEHLCIQDPANYLNDLGFSCKRTRDLQQVWTNAYDRLTVAMEEWESKPDVKKSVLAHGLLTNLDIFEQRRERLSGYV